MHNGSQPMDLDVAIQKDKTMYIQNLNSSKHTFPVLQPPTDSSQEGYNLL